LDVGRHPRLQEIADELCVIKSMNTDQFNHTPAELLLFTGSARQGVPRWSWVTYGLGTENSNLPGFVALISSGVQPSGGRRFGAAAFAFRVSGCAMPSKETPCCTLRIPPEWTASLRRRTLDLIRI
jgi:hypothetical protein